MTDIKLFSIEKMFDQGANDRREFEPLDPNKIDWSRVSSLFLAASPHSRIDADGVERPGDPDGILYTVSAVWRDDTWDYVLLTPDWNTATTSAIAWSQDHRVPVQFIKPSGQ